MKQGRRECGSLGVGGAGGHESVGSLGEAPMEKEGTKNSAKNLRDDVGNKNWLGHPVSDDHGCTDGCEIL